MRFKCEDRGHLRNMPIVLRVCLAARALNKTPHGSVLGLPCGASLCGTGGRRCGNAPMLPRNLSGALNMVGRTLRLTMKPVIAKGIRSLLVAD